MEIHFRVYRRKGSEYWRYDIRYRDPISGRPKRERKRAGKTKASAEKAVLERIKSIEKMASASKIGGALSTLPFREYAMKWLERKKNEIEAKTYVQYRDGIVKYAFPVLGDKPIYSITRADMFAVRDYISAHIKEGSKGKSKNHMMTGLKCLLADAFDRGHIAANPSAGVKKLKFKEEEPKVDPLSVPEILAFLAVVAAFYRDYFTLAFRRGLRHQEIIPLRWMDIDFQTRTIQIQRVYKEKTKDEGEPKTPGSKRDVEMDDELYDMLLRRKPKDAAPDSYVFADEDGGRLRPKKLRKIWREGLATARLRHRLMMQTRHTFASVAISAGEDIYWVMRVMGHTSLQMILKHYGKWINSRTRKDGLAFHAAMCNAPAATAPAQSHEPIHPNTPADGQGNGDTPKADQPVQTTVPQ